MEFLSSSFMLDLLLPGDSDGAASSPTGGIQRGCPALELFASIVAGQGPLPAEAVCHRSVGHPACKLLFVTWDFIQNHTNDLFKERLFELALAAAPATIGTQLFLKSYLGSMGWC